MMLTPETVVFDRKAYSRYPMATVIKQGVMFNKSALREMDSNRRWALWIENGNLFATPDEKGFSINVAINGARIASHPLARKIKTEFFGCTKFLLEKISDQTFRLIPV